jgi:hypothetical protein
VEERRYSKRETGLILRRATDGEIRTQSSQGGLTLDELVAAAREAGIDPAAVRRAALLSSPPQGPLEKLLLGAPVNPVVRARIPGRLSSGGASALRTALDQALERAGEMEEEGGLLIWREEHGVGRTEISAEPDGDFVEVTAVAERKGHLLVLTMANALVVGLLLLPLGGFGGLAAVGGPLLAVVGPFGAVLAGTRALWPVLERRTERQLEAAALEVGARIEEPGPR